VVPHPEQIFETGHAFWRCDLGYCQSDLFEVGITIEKPNGTTVVDAPTCRAVNFRFAPAVYAAAAFEKPALAQPGGEYGWVLAVRALCAAVSSVGKWPLASSSSSILAYV
jgi:hypothetical protein